MKSEIDESGKFKSAWTFGSNPAAISLVPMTCCFFGYQGQGHCLYCIVYGFVLQSQAMAGELQALSLLEP